MIDVTTLKRRPIKRNLSTKGKRERERETERERERKKVSLRVAVRFLCATKLINDTFMG